MHTSSNGRIYTATKALFTKPHTRKWGKTWIFKVELESDLPPEWKAAFATVRLYLLCLRAPVCPDFVDFWRIMLIMYVPSHTCGTVFGSIMYYYVFIVQMGTTRVTLFFWLLLFHHILLACKPVGQPSLCKGCKSLLKRSQEFPKSARLHTVVFQCYPTMHLMYQKTIFHGKRRGQTWRHALMSRCNIELKNKPFSVHHEITALCLMSAMSMPPL